MHGTARHGVASHCIVSRGSWSRGGRHAGHHELGRGHGGRARTRGYIADTRPVRRAAAEPKPVPRYKCCASGLLCTVYIVGCCWHPDAVVQAHPNCTKKRYKEKGGEPRVHENRTWTGGSLPACEWLHRPPYPRHGDPMDGTKVVTKRSQTAGSAGSARAVGREKPLRDSRTH